MLLLYFAVSFCFLSLMSLERFAGFYTKDVSRRYVKSWPIVGKLTKEKQGLLPLEKR